MRLKLVNVKKEFFDIFDFNTEIMTNDKNEKDRPFLVIVSLKYKGEKRAFAIPFRSNIQVNKLTKGLYFPLPRRSTTRPHHAHGLHYIKMFPIDKVYYNKFVMPKNEYNDLLLAYIEKNIKKIIEGAQNYLISYENGSRPKYCTDIDKLISAIDNYESNNVFQEVSVD